mmetsp:Transcript_7759/g.11120  ORF Transcript_7759/g.11120 Transcript_7759/m.11120 type:complete len:852 (+) Transcript_7759:116-2671(+)
MDFSSVERALKSLSRRQPALSDTTVQTSQALLQCIAERASNNSNDVLLEGVLELLKDESNPGRWEPLAVGLFLSTELLMASVQDQRQVYVEGPRVPETSNKLGHLLVTSNDLIKLCQPLVQSCQEHLEHSEPRVRTLVAKAVGAHVQYAIHTASAEPNHAAVLTQQRQLILTNIMTSLYQHLQTGRQEAEAEAASQAAKTEESQQEKVSNQDDTSSQSSSSSSNNNTNKPKYSKSSTGALDDTTGWRALETNWQGLASYIVAASTVYVQENPFDEQLMEAIEYCSIEHVNRHVRAAAIAVLEQLVIVVSTKPIPKNDSPLDHHHHDEYPFAQKLTDPKSVLRTTTVNVLKVTLADNWSQVRMAASVLCRTFWTCLFQVQPRTAETESINKSMYRILIPRMCLNRFYLAQGVKLYSHETWKTCFPTQGLQLVATHAGAICRYYIQMCDADNHVVREAACQAVAELATKIGQHPDHSASLAPFVPMLLQALLMCFHDESWPVRDEACLACGIFCRAYPEECRPELKLLYERWTEQLTDQIWSVREDAAVALGDALMAYPEILPDLLKLLDKHIPAARDQPPQTLQEYKAKQNDIESHTDSQLYSCGSLAPKLGKGSQRKVGAGRIGCSSCGITRPKAPWEATDGCIYLVRELCIKSCTEPNVPFELHDDTLVPLVEQLVDVCRVRHFPQSDDLRCTLWRNVPLMASALGKQRFKRQYLNLFLELLMTNIESKTASALSIHAAKQCVEELATLVSPAIFKGRLMGDLTQEDLFDQVMKERQEMKRTSGAGVGAGDAFSPFGPPDLLLGITAKTNTGMSPIMKSSAGERPSPIGVTTTAFPPSNKPSGLGYSESL